jgi:uncharacterized membrane protein
MSRARVSWRPAHPHHTRTDDSGSVPPGWDYNPASMRQRLPIVGLALIGCAIATVLALYQYGIVAAVWEPFFGDGTRIVLSSHLSRVLPVSDAALGAAGYLADAITGVIGGRDRWRSMPWIVVGFAILVGPLGAISIGLVIAQPVMYNAWCSLCLASAALSVLMIGPAMDEALASLQHLRRVHDRGGSWWRAFWGLAAPRMGTVG